MGSLPSELTQIRAYIDAANYHIEHLQTVAEESAKEQIADARRGLKDAHRGLERLEGDFAFIGEIKREVWQTYRRLRDFEEIMRAGEEHRVREREAEAGTAVRDVGRSRRRVIRAVPAVWTESVVERPEYDTVASAREEAGRVGGGDTRAGARDVGEVVRDDEWGLNVPDTARRLRAKTASARLGEGWPTATVRAPRLVPVRRPARLSKAFEDSPKPRAVTFPEQLPKTRREVLESIAREESRAGPTLNDSTSRRQGSAEGWVITRAVMTGNSDPRVCLPHPAYIKIHEVRELKSWLSRHRYLRRSRGMSKTEKLLHLLTLLQVGCRFESVAVLFSRTPREVLSACKEAFEGMLEMHSETMLPNPKVAKRYLYPDLWHIVRNYGIEDEDGGDRGYLAWGREDIFKVLITLNIYIGRYRRQGRFALQGDILDWGKYIDMDRNEATFNVPRWIERLQTAPPEAGTGQDAPG
jgi:predicted metal-dependent hydrolase